MTLGKHSAIALLTTAALAVPVTAAAPALAGPGHHHGHGGHGQHQRDVPDTIALPDGFQPEGIAVGGHYGYFGSRLDGDIYRADLRTGTGRVVSQGPGTPSLGLKVGPRHRLYVAGGTSGTVRVVDAKSGGVLASLTVNPGTAFVNDVILTRDAAWFTDSRAAQLYRVPIFKDGRLPTQDDVRTLPLTGEWVQPPAGSNGANGITESPDGKALLVVNSTDGTLFRVPTRGDDAGQAELVDLGGASLTNGDGLLLEGRTLYVVRNRLNQVAVLELDRDGDTGRLKGTITSKAFDVPTTIARWRDGLYLPNARFSTTPTPTTTYDVVRVERKR